MLTYGVSHHQFLLNKCQEESSETGINRRYKNSCLPLKKTHFGFVKPHRTVLINNKREMCNRHKNHSITITITIV